MISDRFVASVALMALASGVARGSFNGGELVTESPQLERLVSHVFVGRLIAYHELKASPGRYVAEVLVAAVEKGAGVSPGDSVYVRFTSPKTPAQIRAERFVSGCGDEKVDPLPGEWLRVYTRLNGDFEYVADHPSCFFLAGRRAPPRNLGDLLASRTALALATLLVGLVAGFSIGARSRISTVRSAPARP